MISIYPKITIVTPNYNCAAFLETTILSVLDQAYPNLEYIIIDGGSTDGSLEIIKKYENQLAYWVSEKDNGIYDAINKGFERSTGEIMTWINSDDILCPDTLAYVANVFLNKKEVSWIQGLTTVINEKSEVIFQREHVYSEYFFLTEFSKYNFKTIQQEGTFWRRTLWEKSGARLNTQYKLAGDFDLWIRFFIHQPLYCTNTVLGCFRKREGQKSEAVDLYLLECEESLRKNKSKFGVLVNLKVFGFRFFRKFYNEFQFSLLERVKNKYLRLITGKKKMV